MHRSLCHVTVRRVLQPALVIRNTPKAHLKSRPDHTEEKVDDKPIKFTTSKGSHRRWTVAQSFGSDYARPWYKVLPVSLLLSALLLWIWFREETEIDEILYRPIPVLLEEIRKSKEEEERKRKEEEERKSKENEKK